MYWANSAPSYFNPPISSISAMTENSYELLMKVRDYECDLQGIVNNANYQHYLEHTRHEFLLSIGISFADMSAAGYDFVVSKVTLNYKSPLRSRDEFRSRLYVTREGIKCVFHQEIVRVADNKVCLKGTVESVCIHNGKLVRSTPYDSILEGYLVNK